MSPPNITGLPYPAKRHRPDLAPPYGKKKQKFPTLPRARKENRIRAKLMRKACREPANLFNRDDALALADRLEKAAAHGEITDSQACKVYMRRMRIKIGGALWKLAQAGNAKAFTVLIRSWIVPAEELWGVDPRRLMRQFLSVLQRADIYRKRGYIFLGLHGEFNRNTGCFHLHLHGIADGEMVDVVRGLKKLPRFRFDRDRDLRSPIRLSRLRMTNLPYPLLYTVQDWWPGRFTLSRNGKPVRSRRQRIPEPYHTLLLLWLDRWSLSDMTLMVGMRVGKDGLVKRV